MEVGRDRTDHDRAAASAGPVMGKPAPEPAAFARPAKPEHAALLRLQQTAGNRAVVALLREEGPGGPDPTALIPGGAGSPLDDRDRTAFESALGRPLGHARVHSGPSADTAARALNAEAFTVGSHMYFANGALAPGTADGDRRLGHELMHVLQHDDGQIPMADPASGRGSVSSPTDPLELAAYAGEDAVGRSAAAAREAAGAPPVASAMSASPPTSAQAAMARLVVHRDAAPTDTRPSETRPSETGSPEAGSPETGPSDEQLLPPVPKDPPSIGADGGAPVTLAPPGQPSPQVDPPAALTAPAPVVDAAPAVTQAATPPTTDWVTPSDLDDAPVPPTTDQPSATMSGPSDPEVEASVAAYSAQADAFAGELSGQQQSALDAVTAEVTRQLGAVQATAAQARTTLEAAYDAQAQAVPTATAAALATITAAAEREHAAIATTADGERQRLASAHEQAEQEATTQVENLRQLTVEAGETQAARIIDGSEQRATAITEEGAAARATGDPPSVEAQEKSAQRVAQKAADQCRQTGAKVADVVRQEAAHHADENYQPMLRDHLAKLAESRTSTNQAVDAFVQAANAKVDQLAAEAATAAKALGDQTTETLARERADALAEVDTWEAQASDAINQTGAQARDSLTAQFAPLADELPAAVTANADALRTLTAQQQGDAIAELSDNLAAGRAAATTGVDQVRDAAIAGLAESCQQLTDALNATVEGRVAAAANAGGTVQQGLAAGAAGAEQGMAAATAAFGRRLTDGVNDALDKLTGSTAQFTQGTQDMHDKAVRGLTQAVDDGLRSEDELLAKTRAELAATPGKVNAKYTELKGEAEQQSSTEQPVPAARVHRSIWGSITNFVSDLHERAKKWFADVFGEALGGLLLGILEGLIIVAVGLLVGWAVGAIVGAFIAAAGTAAIVTAVVLLVVAAGLGIYNRFQEFYADNPGQDAGFWRGLGLVGLGIADLTGIPFIVEGLVGQRAFGAKMSRFDANERLGMGIVFLGAALVSARNLLRAKPKVVDEPRVRPQPEPHPNETPPVGLSPKLSEIRAGLSDPRAIERFDTMFGDLKGDSGKMERILAGFAAKGSIEERLIADWDARNPVPEPPRGEALDRVPAAKARAVALREEMVRFSEQNPDVTGLSERIKALDGEIDGFDQMLDGRLEATPESVTGREANVDGIADEFAVTRRTGQVTGVSRKFPLDGGATEVEVDTVGDGGKLWVETKSTKTFGLQSSDWVGKPGKQGLRLQAEELLRAARQNPVDGEPPRVRFEFPKGVSPEVKAALEAMGAEVGGPVVQLLPVPVQVPVGGGGQDNDQDNDRDDDE